VKQIKFHKLFLYFKKCVKAVSISWNGQLFMKTSISQVRGYYVLDQNKKDFFNTFILYFQKVPLLFYFQNNILPFPTPSHSLCTTLQVTTYNLYVYIGYCDILPHTRDFRGPNASAKSCELAAVCVCARAANDRWQSL